MNSAKILVFDVETTGTDPRRDQVIELAYQLGVVGEIASSVKRYRPSIPISARATAVHGITEADLIECPPISEDLPSIRALIDEAEFLVGYNISFDIDMLLAEFFRHNEKPPAVEKKRVLDPLDLWRKCEPRNLSAAVERFAKREHLKAHSALGDVEATSEVLLGMIKAFGLEDKSPAQLADFISPQRRQWIGPTYHLNWQDDIPAFGFGKHKGRTLVEMAAAKDGYLTWLLGTDFPPHVKEIVKSAIDLEAGEFLLWVRTTYRS